MTRTYVDSGVLVWASRGSGEFAKRARAILEEKSEHFRRRGEVELYESQFEKATKPIHRTDRVRVVSLRPA